MEVKAGLTILQKVMLFAMRHFSAGQLCWMCIVITLALALFFATNYATGSELTAVRKELEGVRVGQLQQDMIDTRQMQCDVPQNKRSWYTKRIEDLKRQYRALNDQMPFPLPECTQL
jgi:hypothetical protein